MPYLKNIRIPLFLALLTLLIYANVFNAPFHFDDLSLLLENPQIRSFHGVFSDLATNQRKYLTFFTFAVNFQVDPYHPIWYRVVNVFLHFLTAIILASGLRYLFQAPFFHETKQPHLDYLVWGTAFLFCVHPLQTDSVTYIWQRSEILSGLFYALIIMCYWQGRVQKNWRFLLYAVGFFFIGLYAKGSVVTAPILLGLSEVMFFTKGKAVVKNFGILILGILLIIVFTIIFDESLFNVNFSLDWRYFYTQCLVIWKYLQLTFFPIGQSVDHGFVWAERLWQPMVLLGFSGLLAVMVLIILFSSRYRVACFGAAWFFIYLLPTSSVIPLLTPIFEHRLYFALPGVGLMLADVFFRCFGKKQKAAKVLLIAIICILSGMTVMRNQLWKSRTALMEDAIKKSPEYIRPYFTLGSYYISERRLDEAEKIFQRCVEINPHFADAYNNLGVISESKGRPEEAVELYRKSIKNDPKYIDAYLNLSRYYYAQGRIDLAWEWIEKILSINPDHRVYAYAAFLHMKDGNFDVAQRLLQEGFSKDKSSAHLFYTQGLLYFSQNDIEQAVSAFQSAIHYAPQWSAPFNDLGVVYFMLKEYDLAKDALEQAHRLSPQDTSVYLNLANVYHELGEFDKAEQYYQASRYKGLLRHIPANFDGKDILLLDQGETK